MIHKENLPAVLPTRILEKSPTSPTVILLATRNIRLGFSLIHKITLLNHIIHQFTYLLYFDIYPVAEKSISNHNPSLTRTETIKNERNLIKTAVLFQ